MSSNSGTPLVGESASLDDAPKSKPIESSEVDDGWFDVEVPVESPVEVSVKASPAGAEAASASATSDAENESKSQRATSSAVPGPTEAAKASPLAAPDNASDKSVGRVAVAESVPVISHESADKEHAPKTISSMLPRSLSPVVLASEGRTLSDPPPQPAAEAVTTKPAREAFAKKLEPKAVKKSEPKATKALPTATAKATPEKQERPSVEASNELRPVNAPTAKSNTRYAVLAAATAIAAVAVAVPFFLPKRTGGSTPLAAQPAREPQRLAVAASAADDMPPLVTVAASNTPSPVEASANQAASAAPESASANAANEPSPSAAPSVDSFSDAFHKHAAKKNAKWAEMKTRPEKSSSEAQPASKVAPTKPAKSNQPGAADPLDVLKRLEEARKSRKQ